MITKLRSCRYLNPSYLRQTKVCTFCYQRLPRDQFAAGGHCKKCDHELKHMLGQYTMSENKDCSLYLGVHIAENVLSRYFKDVQKMPLNNPGYDFVCSRGYKIDAKSSCLHTEPGHKQGIWSFGIRKNQVADYFICLAFDNRTDLNPLHVWLISSNHVCHLNHLRIASGPCGLTKWSRFEKPLYKVLTACDMLRGSTQPFPFSPQPAEVL